MENKIYQEDVSSICVELHDFILQHPVLMDDTDEGFDHFCEFIEQRFDKYFPHLYDGEYRNYN